MEITKPKESTHAINEKESMVDPFLVEALRSPSHRLTILRMELDIQRFLQNPEQQQFEFQHFPTSYLRLAAHRVAQHYGLITMVQDNGFDGLVNKILVKKTAESRYPAVHLCDIPAKELEKDKAEQVKIVIRPRPNRGSMNEPNEFGIKRSPVRSVEERKEEYDKARARIFNSPSSPNSDGTVSQGSVDRKSTSSSKDENEGFKNSASDPEKNMCSKDGASYRVAIFRDREKDRTDPDYDRNYGRYRSLPTSQSFNLAPFGMQKIQLPYAQYDTGFPQLGQMPRTQNTPSYQPAASPGMSPFSAMGLNQTSRDPAYMQWPSAAVMYAHSYEQFRHAVFQAPFCQQPLSFDYSQNH